LVLVVAEQMVTETDILIVEHLVKIEFPVEHTLGVDGVWQGHQVKLVEELVEVPWYGLKEESKSRSPLEVALGNTLVHHLEFKWVPLSLDGVLGGCVEPDLVRIILGSLAISNRSQLRQILGLDFDHAVLPEELDLVLGQLVEDEERLLLGWETVDSGEVDGALLLAVITLAFPVAAMNVKRPVLITLTRLKRHRNDILMIDDLLDDQSRRLFLGAGSTSFFPNSADPLLGLGCTVSAQPPVFLLLVVDLPALLRLPVHTNAGRAQIQDAQNDRGVNVASIVERVAADTEVEVGVSCQVDLGGRDLVVLRGQDRHWGSLEGEGLTIVVSWTKFRMPDLLAEPPSRTCVVEVVVTVVCPPFLLPELPPLE